MQWPVVSRQRAAVSGQRSAFVGQCNHMYCFWNVKGKDMQGMRDRDECIG